MKKTYALLSIPVLAFALMLMSYNAGSPGGKSGSPGDAGTTCTQCHTGTANTAADWITTNIPITGYVPGSTYTITLTGTHTGVVKFGFEVTAENSVGAKVGTFILTDPVQTKFTNLNAAVTHTSSGNTPAGNSKTWTVNWTAPAAGTGEVGFYAAFNAANGNGGNSGDVIYKSSIFASEEILIPEITGINPDNAGTGEVLTTTITAVNTAFVGTTPSVSLRNAANPLEIIPATFAEVVSNTELTAGFEIPFDATVGLWDVYVDNLILENGFEIFSTVGVDELSFTGLNIYPNPTYGVANVALGESAEISVWDIGGNLITKIYARDGITAIDLSAYPSGTYFIHIRNDQKLETRKIIRR